jgi:hypothetical protein
MSVELMPKLFFVECWSKSKQQDKPQIEASCTASPVIVEHQKQASKHAQQQASTDAATNTRQAAGNTVGLE